MEYSISTLQFIEHAAGGESNCVKLMYFRIAVHEQFIM